MFVQIDGNSLTYEQIHQVIYEGYSVKISDHALENIKRSRALVEDSITNNKVIYGVNTGFGKFSDTVISKDDLADLQINLIRSHACGLGEPFPIEVSQVMLLLRANALAKGYSGIRLETLQLLIDCLNQNVVPVIPSQGSLGASGDLAPLSHLALLLVGEGEAVFNGEKMSGAEALKLAGLQPIKLQAKEGLALINGTQAMTAVGVVAYMEAQKLADLSDGIAALTLEGLQGIVDAFTPESHSVRPYPEQKQVAERILSYLDGSQLTTTQGQIRVQDAYSLRCIPQVHGAIQQVLNYVK
ncbi:aromatic amino acid lyase, partial [Priestia megaterium]|uniref:HAL/PAL/TAL family ammonia-lyase n=2 Tax=Bacillaceae TaxID=186817 RepID=UPI002FFFECF6